MLYDEKLLCEEQTKIDKCYAQIGQLYYAAHKDDADAEFADCISAIKASEKVMADHRAEVLRANEKMLCPGCGQEIYFKSIFCNFCGLRIVPETPVEEEPAVEEPAVEEPAAEEPPAEEPAAEEPAVEEPAVEEPITQAPVFTAAPTRTFEPEHKDETPEKDEKADKPAVMPTCRVCGAVLEDGCAFCTECGSPVKAPEPDTNAGKVRVCAECGFHATDPEAVFCNSCGSRLPVAGGKNAPATSAKRCPKCGFNTTDPEVRFCIECGTKLQ